MEKTTEYEEIQVSVWLSGILEALIGVPSKVQGASPYGIGGIGSVGIGSVGIMN